MKKTTVDVDIRDDEAGEQLLSGSFVVNVPKRGERANLQFEAMNAAKAAEKDPSAYFEWSEKVLDKYLVSIDVTSEDGKIESREDLEYYEVESLISQICQTVAGGVKLGKKNA